jgi:hypothetical protein
MLTLTTNLTSLYTTGPKNLRVEVSLFVSSSEIEERDEVVVNIIDIQI